MKVCSTKGKEGEINQSVARSNLLPPPLCLSVYTYVIKKLVSLSQFLAPPLVIRGSFCLAKSRPPPPPPPPPPPIAATKNLFCLCQSSGERREEVGRGKGGLYVCLSFCCSSVIIRESVGGSGRGLRGEGGKERKLNSFEAFLKGRGARPDIIEGKKSANMPPPPSKVHKNVAPRP